MTNQNPATLDNINRLKALFAKDLTNGVMLAFEIADDVQGKEFVPWLERPHSYYLQGEDGSAFMWKSSRNADSLPKTRKDWTQCDEIPASAEFIGRYVFLSRWY